jgi:hypothetical protein
MPAIYLRRPEAKPLLRTAFAFGADVARIAAEPGGS